MIEIAHWIWEHRNEPLTFTLIVSFILVTADKLGRKFINNQLKRLFHINDKSEFKQISSNQLRIERKVDMLLEERGLTWSGPIKISSPEDQTSSKRSYLLLQVAYRLNRWRRIHMNKMKSRKFWMAVISAILVVLNEGLDLGVDKDTVLAFAGIVATYIIGESAVDAARKPKPVNPAQAEVAASDEPKHPLDAH